MRRAAGRSPLPQPAGEHCAGARWRTILRQGRYPDVISASSAQHWSSPTQQISRPCRGGTAAGGPASVSPVSCVLPRRRCSAAPTHGRLERSSARTRGPTWRGPAVAGGCGCPRRWCRRPPPRWRLMTSGPSGPCRARGGVGRRALERQQLADAAVPAVAARRPRAGASLDRPLREAGDVVNADRCHPTKAWPFRQRHHRCSRLSPWPSGSRPCIRTEPPAARKFTRNVECRELLAGNGCSGGGLMGGGRQEDRTAARGHRWAGMASARELIYRHRPGPGDVTGRQGGRAGMVVAQSRALRTAAARSMSSWPASSRSRRLSGKAYYLRRKNYARFALTELAGALSAPLLHLPP